MKITFFKNEAHFRPRTSYTWENAKRVDLDYKIQRLRKYSTWLFSLPLLIFTFLFFQKSTSNYIIFIAIIILCLPIHELCHALFCWISGRKVERICFFPYKQVLSSPAAYVKPAFGAWNKTQIILCSLFPLLFLSFVPAILVAFISSLRIWLLFLSLFNFLVSSFDIINILCFLKLPRNCFHFGNLILTVKEADKPIIIHQLSVTQKLDKIDHLCFQYFNNKLTRINPALESSEVSKLRQEFVKQFNLES